MCLRGFPGPSLYLATNHQAGGEDNEGSEFKRTKERPNGGSEEGNGRRGGRRGRMSVGEVQRQELKENNKKGGGGQVMQHFYKQLQTVLKNCFTVQNLVIYRINQINKIILQVSRSNNAVFKIYFNINFVWLN